MSDIKNNKRQFHRIFYNAEASLNSETSSLPCQIIDISLQGCLVRFNSPWTQPLENIYTLRLQLSDDVSIEMNVSVSHVIGNDAGFKCEHIDIDSVSQLRRLVELNLGDSQLLERDLLALTEI
ncbi:MAG: PilZ domain-containing protein [Gammaproteobacteria bacterium]|nr:PilZ domain-containing protein [Methylococcaceae bacterium]